MLAPYCLAIDIGTSRTAAAVARTTPGGVVTASVALGRASDNAPTAVFVGDGELLFGDAAERRGASTPGRLVREFKRRIGDDVPILAGDRAFAPEELYALTVDWAARVVAEREGREPERLAITVPAAWGTYRSDIVRAAIEAHGWRDVDIITEPEAAARHYESTNPLRAGRALAVYDFGGGTFDAVVLRKDPTGAVRIVGSPTGIGDLGGADFDDTIVRHVVSAAKVDAATLAGDAAGRMALAGLRRECVEAKESLSFDSEAVIPVILSGDQRTVRLTRDEFEAMIVSDLERTVGSLEAGLEQSGVSPDDVDAILLTGGSSRIPRVAQVLSERFDRPIAIDADPKAIIALGAARVAAESLAGFPEAANDGPAYAEDDLEALLANASVPAGNDRRRSWFRRLPVTAYIAGASAILLTGAGIAAAPALGSSSLPVSSAAASNPLAFADVLGPLSAFEPLPFSPLPEGTGTPDAAPPTEESSAPGSNPSRDTRAPSSSTKSFARASASAPSTGTKTPSSQADSSPSTPSTKSAGSPKPSTDPAGPGTTTAPSGTTDPGPSDPGPSDPAPNDPGPADPAPNDPDPGPGTPDPAPSDPVDPGPTDPGPSDPGPTDPAPSDPPPDPPASPAPEPTEPVI
jgi:actin-like ATPase involved in cell morphogenesis